MKVLLGPQGAPFLTADRIPADGGKYLIAGAAVEVDSEYDDNRTGEKTGKCLVIPVKEKKTGILYRWRPNGQTLRDVVAELGDDSENWVDKPINIRSEKITFGRLRGQQTTAATIPKGDE